MPRYTRATLTGIFDTDGCVRCPGITGRLAREILGSKDNTRCLGIPGRPQRGISDTDGCVRCPGVTGRLAREILGTKHNT